MDAQTNSFLYELRSNPRFQGLLAEIREARPVLEHYDPVQENVEIMKASSLTQQGFDLAMSFFGEQYD